MSTPNRSSRTGWIAAGTLVVASCLLLAWSAYRYVSSEWQTHLANRRISSRLEYVNEAAVDHARQSRQIRSLIELAAEHIRAIGGTCREHPGEKYSSGLPDEIDLSNWRGKDPDLALLRAFRLLEDDDRINDGRSCLTLSLPPATTDASLAYLADLTNLIALDMPGASVTDAGLTHLQRLTRLYRLNLSRTRVTGSGMERWEGLSDLRVLDLSGACVTDAGLEGLVKLPALQCLDLANTQVTDSAVPRLQ